MEDDHDGQQLQKLALIKTLLIDYCDLSTICLNDPISQVHIFFLVDCLYYDFADLFEIMT
jgi:hypothetical protein